MPNTILRRLLPSRTHMNTLPLAQNRVTNIHRLLCRCLLLHDFFHKYKLVGWKPDLIFGTRKQSSKRSTLIRDVILRTLGLFPERNGKHGRLVFRFAFLLFYFSGESLIPHVNTPQNLEYEHLSSMFNEKKINHTLCLLCPHCMPLYEIRTPL